MKSLRTLIVDDDFAVARVHRGFVESHPNFTVVGEAHSGAVALRLIEELNPDVLLLDFYLPDFSGLEVLGRLRVEHARQFEVIAVTAARDLASVRRASANGVRHYLVKPFTAAALRARLDEIARHQKTLLSQSTPEALNQLTVDEIIGMTHTTRRISTPKGLSSATLDRISSVLAIADTDLSSKEVAEAIGMSRVAARRYLEFLVDKGLASVNPRYGATGRPEHRYRWVRGSTTANTRPR